MSSINRPLSGKALHFELGPGKLSALVDQSLLDREGRTARTLIKEGPLRVTLVGLGAGGSLAEHRADGPLTVQVVSGDIRFRAGEEDWTMEPGELLSLPAGVPHAVASAHGGVFLLTVASVPMP